MNRRHFLQTLLAGAGAAVVPAAALASPRPLPGSDLEAALAAGSTAEPPQALKVAGLDVHPLPLDGLSGRALAVAGKKISSTILEVNQIIGKGLFDPDLGVTKEPDRVRRKIPFAYFGKLCPSTPEDIDRCGAAAVRLFGRLVDAGVLGYGVLAAPSYLEMGHSGCDSTGTGCLIDGKQCERRVLIFFMAFPTVEWSDHVLGSVADRILEWRESEGALVDGGKERLRERLRQKFLNQLAGNECFGDGYGPPFCEDWTSLLCKDHHPTETALCPYCVHDEIGLRLRWCRQTGSKLDMEIDRRSLSSYNKMTYSHSKIIMVSGGSTLPEGVDGTFSAALDRWDRDISYRGIDSKDGPFLRFREVA